MYDESNPDHVITNPKFEYKVNTYFLTIDAAISSIDERFHSTSSDLLRDISLFSINRIKQTKINALSLPKDAFNTFCDIYKSFINCSDLRKEFIQFSRSFFEFEEAVGFHQTFIHKEKLTSETDSEVENEEFSDEEKNQVGNRQNLGTLLHIFQVCHKAGLKDVFPCLYDALHIACTLPVSSTTPERTFSKLKIIKNRLRTTISQHRLEDLMLISCESDIQINKQNVTDIFSSSSSILKQYLI